MSEENEASTEEVAEIISQLSEATMADTVGLVMQNATTIQQGMQTIANAAVSSACAIILAQA
ncbi:RebB family R body protein [Paraneptunicella aestuarii]|uniref:RebB family R body protein n=1 Tax=Paraneptunicella aestuarii TaxID=2831148 RepID=UPI001E326700|nr:RebB family R body protein [Paraneptunicella aestuarii]UAA37892.1 RebB family R body protein [Paraneptunicella aestuarii]